MVATAALLGTAILRRVNPASVFPALLVTAIIDAAMVFLLTQFFLS